MGCRSRLLVLLLLAAPLGPVVIGCVDSAHALGKVRGGEGGGTGMLPDAGGTDLAYGTGGAGGGSNAGGTGGTQVCGAGSPVACPSGQFCDLDTPNQCAAGVEAGHCIVAPSTCIAIFIPVCGCDGVTYASDCERQSARVRLDHAGPCVPFDGGLDAALGCASCNHATDYCQITIGGPVGSSPSYACITLPAACGTSPSCGCLAGVACGNQCIGTAVTGLTINCFVP